MRDFYFATCEHRDAVIALLTLHVVFLVYHFAGQAKGYSRLIGGKLHVRRTAVLSVVLQRLTGFMLFGILPALVIVFVFPGKLSRFGLSQTRSSLPFLGATLFIFPLLIFFGSRSPKTQKKYPVIQVEKWNGVLVIINAASWALYLLAYEFSFRGFLLFTLAGSFGTVPGLLVVTLIYTYIHLPKGAGETLAAFFFGALVGWIALRTGAIWAPYFAHVVIAVSNDTFCILRREDRTFCFSRKNRS